VPGSEGTPRRRYPLGALSPLQGRLRLWGGALLALAILLASAASLLPGWFSPSAPLAVLCLSLWGLSSVLLLAVVGMAFWDVRAVRRHFQEERAKLLASALEGEE
jgi:predicted ABC-type sugar transport system permease subunit